MPPGEKAPGIEIESVFQHPVAPSKRVILTDVRGDNITGVYTEIDDGTGWRLFGLPGTIPPFDLAVDTSQWEPGKYSVRCFAENWSGMRSYSSVKAVTIAPE